MKNGTLIFITITTHPDVAVILTFKIFTKVINELLDYEDVRNVLHNSFLCIFDTIICKFQDFNVGHFGSQIKALIARIKGKSSSIIIHILLCLLIFMLLSLI